MDPKNLNEKNGMEIGPNIEPKLPLGQPQAQNSPGQSNEETGQYLFYNVMPKVNSRDTMVESSVKVIEEEPQASPAAPQNARKKYLWYALGALGILALAAAGYFAYQKFYGVKQPQTLQGSQNHIAQPPASPAASSTQLSLEDWQKKYFNSGACQSQNTCGEPADPDHDGLTNKEEYTLVADPNNPDSDGDGLSDGDEIHVFGSNPLQNHTAQDKNYSDADFFKGGYDLKTGQKQTAEQTAAITVNMKKFGLHEPTIKTLKDSLVSFYKFTDWTIAPPPQATSTASSTLPSLASTSPLSGLDVTVAARQDRDAQRSNTIKNIGIALVKYFQDNKTYPNSGSFTSMFDKVKAYLKVAANPQDPVNQSPYIYIYTPSIDGSDFTLSFYSEVAGQIIKKHAADAQKDLTSEQAGIYDNQRKSDLEMLKTALLLYSNKNAAGNQFAVFPTEARYKTDLVPLFIPQIPKDPKTSADYEYQVSETFDTFTIKTILDDPAKGTTGYLCNQDECRNY